MKRSLSVLVVATLLPSIAAARQIVTTNPLDLLMSSVERLLEDAGVPFDDRQERELALVMEEQRQASERLFGNVMDFSGGPVRGADRDRALAGIQWMNEAFTATIEKILTPEQSKVWEKAQISAADVATSVVPGTDAAASSDQIAQVRINNNAFTAENFGGRGAPGFGGRGGRGGGGGSIEVIERGGVGDFHGNFSFDFRDDALTAQNAYAENKPEFQQRNINANISGPFIRDRLTASFTYNQNEEENASTVVAETPAGPLSLGIVSPAVSRQYSTRGQLQVGADHALHFTGRYGTRDRRNSGVGGFTLPERAWSTTSRDVSMGLREIWTVSPRMLYETVFTYEGSRNESESATDAVTIDVLDAFRSGGANRDSTDDGDEYMFANLWWFEGDRLTFKTGAEVAHRRSASTSTDGFLGEFTFSSLDDFAAGRPLQYRVTRGDPHLAVDQTEFAAFVQTDWRLTPRVTLFTGARYERQTNVGDNDNFDPRVGFAFSPGPSTVIRGGVGLFHETVNLFVIEQVVRLDGSRQYEVVVSDPSYPDPFDRGTAEVVPPSSRRTFAPDLAVPYEVRASLSVERSMAWNISVDASYEYGRGVNQLRTRDVNAPRAGEIDRPMPQEGAVLQLESTARSRAHRLRFGFRQRLSFLTYSASYTLASAYNDADGFFSRPMDNYNPGLDWARARFDERHQYSFSVNSEAPFGTLFTIRGFGNSGTPYTITTGRDDNHDQNTNDRPAGVGRNSAIGPRFFNIDMTLSKTVRLGGDGGRQVSVYANLRNAFNIVNLRNPSGVLTSSRFGVPTSAGAARDVEIGIRYQF